MNKNIKPDNKLTDWRALSYFNFYRILLSGVFVAVTIPTKLPSPLGSLDGTLFIIVSYVYFFTAIIFSGFIHYRILRFNLQIVLQTLADIIMLGLLMYSSSGLGSGFGMLLVIAVAGGSILMAGKIALLFAAIATIFVLGHELYLKFSGFSYSGNYVHAGIMGVTFFITAFVGILLSTRVRETEALAKQQAIEINELARINEHIVQRMHSGIIVLSNNMDILLMNKAARSFLGRGNADLDNDEHVSTLLGIHIKKWLSGEESQNVIIKPDNEGLELQLSFIKLKRETDFQVLTFVEDITKLRQRAQQLKLASLGRLAASIAHEVRNPLGAINHAGQLLNESDTLIMEDRRLVEIIDDHSRRINTIIENVLNISRRKHPALKKIGINAWLYVFRDELISRYKLDDKSVVLEMSKENIVISADPSQLHQIMWNLSENALRYSKRKPFLSFYCDVDNATGRPYIDVIDYGPGIPDNIRESLFEPFFTTEMHGSGLGLYLAQELCEENRATLNLQSSSNKGTIFRIIFTRGNEE